MKSSENNHKANTHEVGDDAAAYMFAYAALEAFTEEHGESGDPDKDFNYLIQAIKGDAALMVALRGKLAAARKDCAPCVVAVAEGEGCASTDAETLRKATNDLHEAASNYMERVALSSPGVVADYGVLCHAAALIDDAATCALVATSTNKYGPNEYRAAIDTLRECAESCATRLPMTPSAPPPGFLVPRHFVAALKGKIDEGLSVMLVAVESETGHVLRGMVSR